MKLRFVITSIISVVSFVGIASAQHVQVFDAGFNGGVFVGLTPVSPTSGLVSGPNVNAFAGRTVRLRIASTNNSTAWLLWGIPSSVCDPSAPFSSSAIGTYGRGTFSIRLDAVEVMAATDPKWAGSCRILTVKLNDGTEHVGRIFFK